MHNVYFITVYRDVKITRKKITIRDISQVNVTVESRSRRKLLTNRYRSFEFLTLFSYIRYKSNKYYNMELI